MRLPACPPLGCLLATLAIAGCVSTEKTTYRDEPRMAVEFENDKAARVFYETFSLTLNKTPRTESNTRIHLPVILDHKEKVVQGESIAFNAAVRACDTNMDGRVTETEAGVYASRSTPR